MHETPDDLERLQRLLEESYAAAGPHLLSIHTRERRLTAERLAALLPGVNVLTVATVSAACAPFVGPVDGLFFRGAWYFGSSPDSVRFRHLRARPRISAAHTRGEELAIVVHGVARPVDPAAADHAGFRGYLLEVYGSGWESWGSGAAYAMIEARRMFTFSMPPSAG